MVDECIWSRPDPGCVPCRTGSPNCLPECEPVEQRVAAGCAGAAVERRTGPDACLLRTPARPIAGGPPVVPLFTCRPGQSLVPLPRPAPFGGASQCEYAAPIECRAGRLEVDAAENVDRCITLVGRPECERQRDASPNLVCEPLQEVQVPASCPMGSALRQAGRDSCLLRVPAVHELPNGNPRERPDGSPDAVLALDDSGAPAWFGLPSLDDVMGWVQAAGANAHRANEFWSGWIRPWCLGRDGLRYRYCHPQRSPSFRGELERLDPNLE